MRNHKETEIYLAKIEDIVTIQRLAKIIWEEWYPNIISHEQIDYMLKKFYNTEIIKKEINDNVKYWLAKNNQEDIGYASAGKINTKENIIKLHKLYVKTSYHGKGIGSQFLYKIIDYANQENAKSIILNVNKQNPSLHYYLSKGFIIEKETVLDIGNNYVMDDFILKLDL